jgi:lipoyl synthase
VTATAAPGSTALTHSTPRTRPAPQPVAQPVRLLGRLAEAGVAMAADAPPRTERPAWMRVTARLGGGYQEMKELVGDLGLTTVCEEAGCPNIYECWGEHRTATFMILGERCTRACGFCLVDTRHPEPPDASEPERVAEAVLRLGLAHVVVTCVARDDLADGGAGHFAMTVAAVRERSPQTTVELLISDVKGDDAALATIFESRPDVLNHNLETVARLQRAARPSAGYARSLAVLARAVGAGLTTKSGLIVGMGERHDEVTAAMLDLRSVGVELLTVGQYLQPTAAHLPVVRWWHPDEFAALADEARAMGFVHVEAAPLVRSSYHAKQAVALAHGSTTPPRRGDPT